MVCLRISLFVYGNHNIIKSTIEALIGGINFLIMVRVLTYNSYSVSLYILYILTNRESSELVQPCLCRVHK